MSIPTSTTSDLQTASAVILNRPAAVASVTLLGDGTHAPTLTIYDNPSAASGKVLAKLTGLATDVEKFHNFSKPVEANTGLYASLSGTGAAYIVTYYAL